MKTNTMELIDQAHAAAKAAAHSCRDELARRHFEYALALLSEAWIAEDGQDARSPECIMGEVRGALDLFDAFAA